jgi:anthranilate phosphoribosyltransferase
MSALTFEQPLSTEEMSRVMTSIMTGQWSAEEIQTFLATLARRGETAEEIAAAVQVLRAHAVRLPLSRAYELCDTCGTGGDGKGTFNVSTLAALVAAGSGVRVSKHGNRAASSRCGSADLLEALGVNISASPIQVARCIDEVGFGFCFAPVFHPAMKVVAPIRKALGIRTLFNLIGPLANPAPLTFQLVGVSEERLLRPMAEALVRLGVRHALVVHGRDGLDEVTTTDITDILEVRAGGIIEQSFDPDRLGIARQRLEDVRGGDAKHNATLARALLAGEFSVLRDIIAVNAGCAIYAADHAKNFEGGIAKAKDVLASGRAMRIVTQLQGLTSYAG